jgi:hypothetical protein
MYLYVTVLSPAENRPLGLLGLLGLGWAGQLGLGSVQLT